MTLLLALAVLLGWDSWRTGASWDDRGRRPDTSVLSVDHPRRRGALWLRQRRGQTTEGGKPSLRARAARVLQVFVPTLLFCLAMQWLGLYVASFLLIAGFMGIIGKIAWWKSLLTAFIFVAIMFVVFDVAFDVIMPKGPLEAAFGR